MGNGKKQFLCYVVYGISGSRWSLPLKKQTQSILEAAFNDAASRGLPALVGGDFNLEVGDSEFLQRLPQLGWSRAAEVSGVGQTFTCYKGTGSVIDHVFCNQMLMASFREFFVGDRHGLADHCPINCLLNLDVTSQVVSRNREYGELSLQGIPNALQRPACLISSLFRHALEHGDMDTAFRAWCGYAEKHLEHIYFLNGWSGEFKKGRGTIRIDPQPLWPQSRGGEVACLSIRRLWKQCSRMVEIQKRPYGQKALRTWANAFRALDDLDDQAYWEARSLLSGRCSHDSAARLQQLFENAIVKVQREQKQQRIKAWKHKLQSSLRAQHSWLRNDGQSSSGFCFAGPDGARTANVQQQFQAVRDAWRAVNELFKDGEPDHSEFFRKYEKYISSSPVELPPLTPDLLKSEILSIPLSCPGLDAWKFQDLKLLVRSAPWVFDELCECLVTIEQQGTWPQSLISGFTSLIPKCEQPPEVPTDLRPITVLGGIYRIWARIRAKQLGAMWQELWAHGGMFGGRQGRGPEPLLFAVCLDLESTSQSCSVGGISFDLAKAFDRIPRELLGRILRRMSLPSCVLRPYMGMLRKATRRYKLGVCLDAPQTVYGGILQGCPLSMMALNCVVNIWLRSLSDKVPRCRPRAYADDVSITTDGSSSLEVRDTINAAYTVSLDFVGSIGGLVNHTKSFTFGDPSLDGCIPGLGHSDAFRLIGGSVAYRAARKKAATDLEINRMKKWSQTVQRARHLPVAWNERSSALLRTRTQYTFASGTHCLCETKEHQAALTRLRSDVMRCLLRRDRYVASPSIYFTLVASPSLNPFFSRVMDGLLVAWRSMEFAGTRQKVKRMFLEQPSGRDGPVARLQQVDAMNDFKGVVRTMLDLEPSQLGKWLHTTRETWRLEQWRKVSRDRPLFRGIELGVLKDVTLCYLRQLEDEGYSGPMDSGSGAHEQARMKAAVLRLLLCGGLFTRDVVSQHKLKQCTECDCAIGGVLDVCHVSWTCAHFAHLRGPIAHLEARVQRSKPCFRYATIVCYADADLAADVILVQQTLVNIWQCHIKSYLYGDIGPGAHSAGSVASAVPIPASLVVEDAILENGHHIVAMQGGGVWCRKCGIYVRETKHRRLKISYRRCTQAQLEQRYWLVTPSFRHNPHRLLDLFNGVVKMANGHHVAWNCSVSRSSPYGLIRCLLCGKEFRWDNRHNIKNHQSCRSSSDFHSGEMDFGKNV